MLISQKVNAFAWQHVAPLSAKTFSQLFQFCSFFFLCFSHLDFFFHLLDFFLFNKFSSIWCRLQTGVFFIIFSFLFIGLVAFSHLFLSNFTFFRLKMKLKVALSSEILITFCFALLLLFGFSSEQWDKLVNIIDKIG